MEKLCKFHENPTKKVDLSRKQRKRPTDGQTDKKLKIFFDIYIYFFYYFLFHHSSFQKNGNKTNGANSCLPSKDSINDLSSLFKELFQL